MTTIGDSIVEEPSLEERLVETRKSIHKLTRDALKKRATAKNRGCFQRKFQGLISFGNGTLGQDVSHVEKNVRNRLGKIEQELQCVLEEVNVNVNEQMSTTDVSASTEESSHNMSSTEIQCETEQLQIKVRFLQHCSSARSLLDESIALSTLSTQPNLTASAQKRVQVNLSEETVAFDPFIQISCHQGGNY